MSLKAEVKSVTSNHHAAILASGVKDHQIHSLIVFVGDSTFKTEMPPNVTYGFGYLRFIKSKTEPVFTDTEVEEIVEKIQKVRLAPSFKTHREHVAHVRDILKPSKVKPVTVCSDL